MHSIRDNFNPDIDCPPQIMLFERRGKYQGMVFALNCSALCFYQHTSVFRRWPRPVPCGLCRLENSTLSCTQRRRRGAGRERRKIWVGVDRRNLKGKRPSDVKNIFLSKAQHDSHIISDSYFWWKRWGKWHEIGEIYVCLPFVNCHIVHSLGF